MGSGAPGCGSRHCGSGTTALVGAPAAGLLAPAPGVEEPTTTHPATKSRRLSTSQRWGGAVTGAGILLLRWRPGKLAQGATTGLLPCMVRWYLSR